MDKITVTFNGHTLTRGSENAELGAFFRFIEKKHKTKRHVNAILAAGIDTTEALESKLNQIGLLRGLDEKSAKEVINAYEAYKEANMTPEEKQQKIMQSWNLAAAASATPYEVGETVFFFGKVNSLPIPVIRQGTVRAVKMWFGYMGSNYRVHGKKQLQFSVYVWNEVTMSLGEFEPRTLFRTKKAALSSIKVAK